MSVQRYGFVMSPYGCDQCGILPDRGGDYVRFDDYAALEARCAGLHKQLADVLEISTAVPFDRCIIHAGERLAGRLMQVDALQASLDSERTSIDNICKDYRQRTNELDSLRVHHKQALGEREELKAKLAEAEEALIVISRLPYCDRHLSKDLARVALADTTTDEVQP
jgi:hypothetical protein